MLWNFLSSLHKTWVKLEAFIQLCYHVIPQYWLHLHLHLRFPLLFLLLWLPQAGGIVRFVADFLSVVEDVLFRLWPYGVRLWRSVHFGMSRILFGHFPLCVTFPFRKLFLSLFFFCCSLFLTLIFLFFSNELVIGVKLSSNVSTPGMFLFPRYLFVGVHLKTFDLGILRKSWRFFQEIHH